jgi:hypothetical protein
MPRYVGYHETRELPFKRGDKVIIPVGTRVRSYNPSKKDWVTTRKQVVTVNTLMNGMSVYPSHTKLSDIESMCRGKNIDVNSHYIRWELLIAQAHAEQDPTVRSMLYREHYDYRIPVDNPTVQWAGTGGYWAWVDINDILAANAVQEAA